MLWKVEEQQREARLAYDPYLLPGMDHVSTH